MYLIMLRMDVSPQDKSDVINGFESLIGPTIETMPECVDCGIYGEFGDEDKNSSLLFIQKWKDEDAVNRYLHSQNFNNILQLMELAVEPPELEFLTVLSSSGMESISNLQF